MTHVLLSLAAAALIASPTAASQCRDAKGKFIKCPPKPAPKKAPCKDVKGKFIKCPS